MYEKYEEICFIKPKPKENKKRKSQSTDYTKSSKPNPNSTTDKLPHIELRKPKEETKVKPIVPNKNSIIEQNKIVHIPNHVRLHLNSFDKNLFNSLSLSFCYARKNKSMAFENETKYKLLSNSTKFDCSLCGGGYILIQKSNDNYPIATHVKKHVNETDEDLERITNNQRRSTFSSTNPDLVAGRRNSLSLYDKNCQLITNTKSLKGSRSPSIVSESDNSKPTLMTFTYTCFGSENNAYENNNSDLLNLESNNENSSNDLKLLYSCLNQTKLENVNEEQRLNNLSCEICGGKFTFIKVTFYANNHNTTNLNLQISDKQELNLIHNFIVHHFCHSISKKDSNDGNLNSSLELKRNSKSKMKSDNQQPVVKLANSITLNLYKNVNQIILSKPKIQIKIRSQDKVKEKQKIGETNEDITNKEEPFIISKLKVLEKFGEKSINRRTSHLLENSHEFNNSSQSFYLRCSICSKLFKNAIILVNLEEMLFIHVDLDKEGKTENCRYQLSVKMFTSFSKKWYTNYNSMDFIILEKSVEGDPCKNYFIISHNQNNDYYGQGSKTKSIWKDISNDIILLAEKRNYSILFNMHFNSFNIDK